MDKAYLLIPALIVAVGCQRPVTDPKAFSELCGVKPTQEQAELAAYQWVATEFPGATDRIVQNVVVVGKADRRFGALNLGARRYGWKLTFYVKKKGESEGFTDVFDLLWNNGTFYAGNDGY